MINALNQQCLKQNGRDQGNPIELFTNQCEDEHSNRKKRYGANEFAQYGIPMKDYLEKYCCHIGKHGEYDWDIFSFLEYTIVRSFDYDIHGNINKVTITRTHAKSNEKTIWIETFPIQD